MEADEEEPAAQNVETLTRCERTERMKVFVQQKDEMFRVIQREKDKKVARNGAGLKEDSVQPRRAKKPQNDFFSPQRRTVQIWNFTQLVNVCHSGSRFCLSI